MKTQGEAGRGTIRHEGPRRRYGWMGVKLKTQDETERGKVG